MNILAGTLQQRLMRFGMIVVSVVCLIFAVIEMGSDFLEEQKKTTAGVAALMDITGENLQPFLAFNDPEGAHAQLQGLLRRPDILGARLLRQDGTLLAEVAQAAAAAPELGGPLVDLKDPDIGWILGPSARLSQTVAIGREPIGMLELHVDLRPLWHEQLLHLAWVVLASAIGIGVTYLIARRLKGAITQPLEDIDQAVAKIAASRQYGVRVQRSTDDEIGQLADRFNIMLAEIEAADAELKRHRDHLEEEVDKRTTAMRAAKEEAERASRAKSEFVSRMSHELRTPLNAIIGFADLLKDEPLGESQRRYVELINGSGKHLMELINAVLDHAKIEAGRLTLEAIDFDLAGLVGSVGSMIGARASEKGLEFSAHVAADLPRRVVGDPTRLRQILINLLGNAIKFTERGEIELRVTQEEGRLVFVVRDTGIGMDAATLAKLFQPFRQADESVSRKFGGTGLGLLIARELIAAMGGSIAVESTQGAGSTFRFWLPLQEAETQEPERVQAATAAVTGQDCAELACGRVLLVDDNGVNRQLAGAMLDRLGLDYETAANGAEALQQLDGGGYALVLMDVEMPEMDGIAATRRLRATEVAQGQRRVPVIALTANALQEDRTRCLAAGMDGYVAKPIDLAALRSELLRVLGGAAAPASDPPPHDRPVVPEALYDRAAAIERMGDAALFEKVSGMFLADAPGHLAAINANLAAGDIPALARSAHTLKSLCATFCAAPSEAAALQLEQAARAGDAAACRPLVAELQSRVEALTAALARK